MVLIRKDMGLNGNGLVNYLDWFPKIKEDIKIQSPLSGALSIFTYLVIICIILSEAYSFLRTDLINQITVDGSINNTLSINLDMFLPSLACDSFGIDIADTSGSQQLGLSEDVIKIPTNKAKSGSLPGCQVKSTKKIRKVRGELHLAFGKQVQAVGDQGHMHRFLPEELLKFNCSHIINKFSIGDNYPSKVDPLEGVTKTVPKLLGRYQYFIQIVPTQYLSSNNDLIETAQYSFTEMDSIVNPNSPSFMQPGIFFKYDISPYLVTYKEQHKSLSHLITSISALIGGIWAITSVTSSWIFYFEQKFL